MEADFTKFQNHPQASAEEARVVILSLPSEMTVSYMKGTAGGPAAILAASHQLEDWEEDTGLDTAYGLPMRSLGEVAPAEGETTAAYAERVHAAASACPEAFMVALGGEHSVTWPVIRARMAPGDTVVVIDAHPDLRSAYEGDPLSHASVVRRIVEGGFRVVQIGTGCNTKEEADFVEGRADFRRFWAREAATEEGYRAILETLGWIEGRVWLSIDLDGLCTSIMPGVGTPVPGGLSWHRAVGIIERLFANDMAKVVGLDVVELRPLPESELSEFTAAKLIQKCLARVGRD